MEGSMLTISLGIWMELPGVNYRDLTLGKRKYALWRRTAYMIKAASISTGTSSPTLGEPTYCKV